MIRLLNQIFYKQGVIGYVKLCLYIYAVFFDYVVEVGLGLLFISFLFGWEGDIVGVGIDIGCFFNYIVVIG